MEMYRIRILITFLLLAGYWPVGSHGFFWPLTVLFGKSASSPSITSTTQNGPLSEIILRPYMAGDSTDLAALSSSSSSSSNLFGSEMVPLQTHQLPQQAQSNYGYVNLDGSTSSYSGSSSSGGGGGGGQQQEQTFQHQIEQVPLDQTLANEPQLQQQPQQYSHFFNPANLFDSKRFSYINRFKHQRQQQQPVAVTASSTKYVVPNLDQNQYLIFPKPVPSISDHSHGQQEPQPSLTNNVQPSSAQQPPQSTVQQQKFPANNWVYVSPVNKLNSQQQPVLLEAYFQDPSGQHHEQAQQNYQVGSIKGMIGKTGKQRTSSTSGTGNTVKIPLLSWLPIAPSQIHLPLHWLKAKSQQPADQLVEEQPQHYYSSTIQHQKPLYGYTSLSAPSHFSNGNSAISKPQTQQVQVQSSNQQQSLANGYSSTAELASTNRLLTGTVHSPQQQSALQFWIETDRQPGRVIFPKPTTITTSQYSPQQPYQTSQDYHPLRNGLSSQQSSSATLSQVESNQDLGGWDSIPMADIVKPAQHQSQPLQHENSETMDSNIMETMMPSASSDQSVVMNETVTNQQQQPSQQQQARETITGQQQQQSHRVIYQQQQQQQHSPQ
ncbi:hypothetical protein BLA29_002228, partial [Euroglyphus maynei]